MLHKCEYRLRNFADNTIVYNYSIDKRKLQKLFHCCYQRYTSSAIVATAATSATSAATSTTHSTATSATSATAATAAIYIYQCY